MDRYVQLYTTVTLEGLMDTLDGITVAESWADAAYHNTREEAEHKRPRKGRR